MSIRQKLEKGKFTGLLRITKFRPLAENRGDPDVVNGPFPELPPFVGPGEQQTVPVTWKLAVVALQGIFGTGGLCQNSQRFSASA